MRDREKGGMGKRGVVLDVVHQDLAGLTFPYPLVALLRIIFYLT